MAPSPRPVEAALQASRGNEQPGLDHLAAHSGESPVVAHTPLPVPDTLHPSLTTATCSAAAAPALRVEGGFVRGDSAPRGTGASTADMNYDIGVKPVGPPSAFDSAKEGDLSRLASLQPGAERGAQWDATLDGPKPATDRGCTSAERSAGASEGPGAAKACEQYGILFESSTAPLTPNDSPERTTNDSPARASTGQHTPTPHAGTGVGSDSAEPLSQPESPAPAALSVPGVSALSGPAASFSDTAGEHSLGSQLVDGNRPTANVLASPALLLPRRPATQLPRRRCGRLRLPHSRTGDAPCSLWRRGCRPSGRWWWR